MLDSSPIVSGRAYSSGSPIFVTISSNFEAEVCFTISNVCNTTNFQMEAGSCTSLPFLIVRRQSAYTLCGVAFQEDKGRPVIQSICLSERPAPPRART
jgi:hypothetical protein